MNRTMDVSIDTGSGYVLMRFRGKGTAEEVKSAFLEALRFGEEAGLHGIMLDSRESRVHPDFDAMRDLASFVMELQRNGLPRTALIVKGPLQYGLARMFGSLVEFSTWEFRIFRDTESADAWLQRDRG